MTGKVINLVNARGKLSVRQRLAAQRADYEKLQAEASKMLALLGGIVLQSRGEISVPLHYIESAFEHDGLRFENDKETKCVIVRMGPRTEPTG